MSGMSTSDGNLPAAPGGAASFAASAFLFLAACGSAFAVEEAIPGGKAPEISAAAWANHSGDPPTLASLRGRPVLLVFWGMNCQVCLCRDQLRKCETAYRKHRPQGLEVLGLHAQEAGNEVVDLYALKNDITFPIGSGGYNTAYGVTQVPRLFLVDSEGILVWDGDDLGGEFQKKLAESLKSVDFMGETRFPKAMKPMAGLAAQRKFSKLIDRIIDFMADPKQSADDKKFAGEFKKRLEETAERDLNRADGAIRIGDPAKGLATLERISAEFKDHPLGRKADIRIKEVREDKEIKPLMKAAETYKRFRDCIRAGDSRGARAAADLLLKAFPDTLYARRTRDLVAAFDKVAETDKR